MAYGGDTFEEVLRIGFVGAFEGFDEDYARVGLLVAWIDAFYAERHG